MSIHVLSSSLLTEAAAVTFTGSGHTFADLFRFYAKGNVRVKKKKQQQQKIKTELKLETQGSCWID